MIFNQQFWCVFFLTSSTLNPVTNHLSALILSLNSLVRFNLDRNFGNFWHNFNYHNCNYALNCNYTQLKFAKYQMGIKFVFRTEILIKFTNYWLTLSILSRLRSNRQFIRTQHHCRRNFRPIFRPSFTWKTKVQFFRKFFILCDIPREVVSES